MRTPSLLYAMKNVINDWEQILRLANQSAEPKRMRQAAEETFDAMEALLYQHLEVAEVLLDEAASRDLGL